MSKKILTKKQHTILILIYTFRFIHSKQIQQFLGHSDHRRINAWLKDLVEKQYIHRDYTPVFGTLTKPAVYFLTTLGRQYIRETFGLWGSIYLKRLRDDTRRSKAFRVKCQLIADCSLTFFSGKEKQFVEYIQALLKERVTVQDSVLQLFTPAFYEELDFDFPLLTHCKPDAYMRETTTEGIDHACLYIIDAYVPRLTLQYMIKDIFQLVRGQPWETEDVSSLQFYFICPSNMVIIYLTRLLHSFLKRYYNRKPVLFYFTTRNQLYKKKDGKSEKIGWKIVSS